MAKIKVLDLAKEVGMEDEKLLQKLKKMGVKVKDKKTEEPEKVVSLSDERIIQRDSGKEVVEKRVKSTVIRRRTRTLEPVASPPSLESPMVSVTAVEAPAAQVPRRAEEKHVLRITSLMQKEPEKQ